MDLQTMLERVEPTRLKQLGSLLALGDSLTKPELVDWVSQELPFCQVEEDGACVGIDGAFYIAVDWVGDIITLELLRDTTWIRHQSDGNVIEFGVTDAAAELSVDDARLLLALLAIATYNEGELPIPKILTSNRFESCLTTTQRVQDAPSTRPSQRPSQLPPPSQRPSIPPGLSATFDSMRPQRHSVRPEAQDAGPASRRLDPALIEWMLTLSRHSIISAAFALTERGVDTHAIAVDPTGGRAVLPADTLEAAEKLFDDHRDSLPPPSQTDVVLSYRKQLSTSLSYFGISPSDASALVTLAAELGCFPDFWSKSNPPPRGLARDELRNAPEELTQAAATLLYDAFYAEQFDSVGALVKAFIPA